MFLKYLGYLLKIKRTLDKKLISLITRFLRVFPKNIKYPMYRQLINLNYDISDRFVFKLANTREELEEAYSLIYSAYLKNKFIPANDSKLYTNIYFTLPSTSTLIVKDMNKVIGTISLVRDNPIGLPVERVFNLNSIRKEGARLAEVSSLVIAPSYRRSNNQNIFFPLIKYLFEYSLEFFGIDYLIIAIYPHHDIFYESFFGFDKIENGLIKTYLGAPASIEKLKIDYKKLYDDTNLTYYNKPLNKNLHEYIFNYKCMNFIFPERKYFKTCDPILSIDMLRYFFVEKSSVLQTQNTKVIEKIRALYKNKDFDVFFKPFYEKSFALSRNVRFEVNCKAMLISSDNEKTRINIKNVSISGFYCISEKTLEKNALFNVKIMAGEFTVIELKAQVVWTGKDNDYGLKVLKHEKPWNTFIDYLLEDLHYQKTT